MKTIHLAYVLSRLCAKNLFQIFGYLEKSVDPDKPLADQDLHCFQAVYAKLHNS